MQLSIKHFLFLFFLFSLPSIDAQEMNFSFQEPLSAAFLENEILAMNAGFGFSETNPFGETAFSLDYFFMLPDNSLLTNVFSGGPNKNYWDDGSNTDRYLGDPISGLPIKNGTVVLLFVVFLYFFVISLKKIMKKYKYILPFFLCLFAFTANAQVQISIDRQVLASTPLTIELSEMSQFTACSNAIPTIEQNPSINGTLAPFIGGIVYQNNWAVDSKGTDSFKFQVVCGATTATVTVNLVILPKPDNIREADCFFIPPAQTWSIVEALPINTELVDTYGHIFTGDLNGDGNLNVITTRPADDAGYLCTGMKIFNYSESANGLELGNQFAFPNSVGTDTRGSSAIFRHNGIGYIVVPGTDGYLYGYNIDGVQLWKSDTQYRTGQTFETRAANFAQVGIADFNNDGIPEIYAGNKIYTYNGIQLCDGGSANNKGVYYYYKNVGISGIAADIDGDGILELIAGTQIYEVNIAPGSTSGSISLKAGWQLPDAEYNKIPSASRTQKDGLSMVVDINNDGKLEVVVISTMATTTPVRATVFVWTPQASNQSQLVGYFSTSHYFTTADSRQYSTPMIGNIDTDPNLEIVYITSYQASAGAPMYMHALRYDNTKPMGQRIVEKWRLPHTDTSGATGATLFDFNQDGIAEIVYRDEETLRIIDGSGSTASIKATFSNVRSGTVREYPIVVDIDRDGQAEILVAGWTGTASDHPPGANNSIGPIRIFKSGGAPWAPARSVWNQYMYNAVNVNEDLTVPKYQLNSATLFPGKDKKFGTLDDVHPFNNFMQQQTTINQFGVPFFPAPDLSFTSNLTHSFSGTGMNISVEISNVGEAVLYGPIYISVYKGSIASGNLLVPAYEYTGNLIPGQKATINLPELPNASLNGITQLIINLNDNGNGIYPTEECNTDNNRLIIPFSDDYYGLPYVVGTTSYFDFLKNDAEFSSITITNVTTTHTLTSSAGATVSISAPRSEFSNRPGLSYTPKTGFFGIDVIQYAVSGTGYSTTGTCYIYVFEAMGRLCEDENIYNISINDLENDVKVVWRQQTNPFTEVTQLIFTGSGTQVFPLDAQVYFNVSTSDEISAFNNRIPTNYRLMVTPPALYWDKDAMDNNWNNPSNWLYQDLTHAYMVPLKCTNVHIPGQATIYPNLDPIATLRSYFYDTPECDSIIYHFGGETAKPNLLDYERAFVQYNVGYYNLDGSGNATGTIQNGDTYSPAVHMDRDRWYALAAPLNKMVTGDFSFGGMPSTWQKGFIATDLDGGLTRIGQWHEPSNNNILELNESHSYAIAYQVAGIGPDDVVGEGKEYHRGLFQTRGIIEIPYFENTALSTAHRIHEYNAATQTSTFYYYYYQNAGAPVEWSKKDEYIRNASAYRFIFDGKIEPNGGNPRFKVTVPTGKEIMIGNPFLSSLDFNAFYNANVGKISNYYRLYEDGLWDEYSYPVLSPDHLIAPLQAFFINVPTGAPTVDLYFPFAASVSRTDVLSISEPHQLRSSQEPSNILQIIASSNNSTNSITLDLNDEVDRENVYKLFYEYSPNKPQIYFTDKRGQKNAIQYSDTKNETEIPLGINMASGNVVNLIFSNVENLNNESLFLVDKKTGTCQDLFKNPKYNFVHNDDKAFSDRFVLKIGASDPTYIDRLGNSGQKLINVYQTNENIIISSFENIERIELFDLQGNAIGKANNINDNIYQMNLNVSSGIYLIKTILTNGESQTDKISIR